jgi:hypothetical protein
LGSPHSSIPQDAKAEKKPKTTTAFSLSIGSEPWVRDALGWDFQDQHQALVSPESRQYPRCCRHGVYVGGSTYAFGQFSAARGAPPSLNYNYLQTCPSPWSKNISLTDRSPTSLHEGESVGNLPVDRELPPGFGNGRQRSPPRCRGPLEGSPRRPGRSWRVSVRGIRDGFLRRFLIVSGFFSALHPSPGSSLCRDSLVPSSPPVATKTNAVQRKCLHRS